MCLAGNTIRNYANRTKNLPCDISDAKSATSDRIFAIKIVAVTQGVAIYGERFFEEIMSVD